MIDDMRDSDPGVAAADERILAVALWRAVSSDAEACRDALDWCAAPDAVRLDDGGGVVDVW